MLSIACSLRVGEAPSRITTKSPPVVDSENFDRFAGAVEQRTEDLRVGGSIPAGVIARTDAERGDLVFRADNGLIDVIVKLGRPCLVTLVRTGCALAGSGLETAANQSVSRPTACTRKSSR